jgi:biotin carboxylase
MGGHSQGGGGGGVTYVENKEKMKQMSDQIEQEKLEIKKKFEK